MNYLGSVGYAMRSNAADERQARADAAQEAKDAAMVAEYEDAARARELERARLGDVRHIWEWVNHTLAEKKRKKEPAAKALPMPAIPGIPGIPGIAPSPGLAGALDDYGNQLYADGGEVVKKFDGIYDDTLSNGRLPRIFHEYLDDMKQPGFKHGHGVENTVKMIRACFADGGAVDNGVGTPVGFADGGEAKVEHTSIMGFLDHQFGRMKPKAKGAVELRDGGAVRAQQGDVRKHEPENRDSQGRVIDDMNYGDPRDDDHIRGQNHLDHMNARARLASDLKKKGQLGKYGTSQKDIDDFETVYGPLDSPKRGYVGGGAIRGPGTGTSDSIPARLSNGEYVLSADTVRAVGKDKLDALQARFHKSVR